MKRIFVVVLICLLLPVGCGLGDNPGDSQPPADTAPIHEAFSAPANPANLDGDDIPGPEAEAMPADVGEAYVTEINFGQLTDEIIALLDGNARHNGYPVLADLARTDEEEEIDGQKYNLRSYTLAPGAYLYLSETLTEGALFSVMLFGLIDSLDADTLDLYQFYLENLIVVFAPEDYTALFDELDVTNFAGEFYVTASTDKIWFSNGVQSGRLTFSINPL